MKKNSIENIRYLKWRFSRTYLKTFHYLKKTQNHSVNYFNDLQLATLKEILIYASENVIYYKELFRKHKLNPYHLKSFEEFQDYPFLEKRIYQEESAKFISSTVLPEKLMKAYTGGTTGEPVPLYRYWHDIYREKAFTNFVYQMLGINPYCKKVIIRGQANDNIGQYFYRTEFGNVLRLSSLNLSDQNLEQYFEQIGKFEPELLFATPSVSVILCQFMEKHGIKPVKSLKWAFTPSENLYEIQKEYIESIMKCKVVNSYGQSEHVVSAARCGQSDLYHVLPQYSYAELIGTDGKPVNKEGQTGEIVGTSFTNTCCPLIRYRTGDYAVFTNEKCGCGRDYQMWKSIQGRQASIAWTKDDRPVSLGPELLCTLFGNTYSKIRHFSIEQKKKGELLIHITPFHHSEFDEIKLFFENIFAKNYPGSFVIQVMLNKELKLTEAGKSIYFTQHLKIKEA